MDSAIRILPLALCFARVIGDAGASAKLNGPFLSHSRKPQLIAFNTKGGDIDVSLPFDLPFDTPRDRYSIDCVLLAPDNPPEILHRSVGTSRCPSSRYP
jgi:hypothetical protein